jgi:hypothetical protein
MTANHHVHSALSSKASWNKDMKLDLPITLGNPIGKQSTRRRNEQEASLNSAMIPIMSQKLVLNGYD